MGAQEEIKERKKNIKRNLFLMEQNIVWTFKFTTIRF